MALSMDSDEEDSFVYIGKQVKQIDEDEPRKKPVSVHDLPVTDSKGRQRFHGAFTGGFSAGYFNSVGTKEGWTPSTFVSKRSSKSENPTQKAEDFMDEEDFTEHGIAPRKIATSHSYSSEENSRKRKNLASAITGASLTNTEASLIDLIVPETLPMGIWLLRKMGWKDGQGIGPRVSKKRRRKLKKDIKEIGCSTKSDSSSEESYDEEYLKSVTFAPKDTNPVLFVAKENVHGLGYSGLNANKALPSGHINLFEPPPVKANKGKRGIHGKAFGIGALEDEDDDIYAVDHLSNYDITMDIEDSNPLSDWTAPKHSKLAQGAAHVGYVGKLLEGFTLSTKPLKPHNVYPPPVLPRHFRPVHRFKGPVVDEAIANLGCSVSKNKGKSLTSVDRALKLGEISDTDLGSKQIQEAKLKILSLKDIPLPPLKTQDDNLIKKSSRWDMPVPNKISPEKITSNTFSLDTDFSMSDSHESTTETLTEKPENKSLFTGNLSQFKPFSRFPEKQERYDKYLSSIKLGHKDPYSQIVIGDLTEWEQEREKEEFVKAAKLYKPLSAMMASRFTTAKYDDNTDTVHTSGEKENEKNDKLKAAEKKMYGLLTREVLEWHPDKLLCKRFNVPDPFPGSSIVGLPSVKRNKYSVYNFLSFPTSTSPETPTTTDAPLAIENRKDTTKPQDKISFNIKRKDSIFNILFEKDATNTKPTEADSESSSQKLNENLTTDKKLNTTTDADITEDKVKKVPGTVSAAPIDLFQAIFNDSDDSSNTSSDEDSDHTQQTDSSQIGYKMDTISDLVKITENSEIPRFQVPRDGNTDSIHEKLFYSIQPTPSCSDTTATNNVSIVHHSLSDEEEMYGPALPTYSTLEPFKHENVQSHQPKHKHKKKKKKKNSGKYTTDEEKDKQKHRKKEGKHKHHSDRKLKKKKRKKDR